MTCPPPRIIIEVRPRLQVCHVFIKQVRAEAVQLERGGELKIVCNGGRNRFKVSIPGTELKPQSLSNFTLLDQSEGTYFRIATLKCSLTHAQSVSLFDYSARDTTYVPQVDLNAPQALFCRCCGSRLMRRSVRFQRILPLPSDSWDMSDMFCHLHEGEDHTSSSSSSSTSLLHPKSGDLLYGAYNFVLAIGNEQDDNLSKEKQPTNAAAQDEKAPNAKKSPNAKKPGNAKKPPPMLTFVRMSQRIVKCEICSFWLGTKQSESLVTLWNSTVEFKRVAGDENETLIKTERSPTDVKQGDENETLIQTERSGIEHVLVEQKTREETDIERHHDAVAGGNIRPVERETSTSEIDVEMLPSKLATTRISEEKDVVDSSNQCLGNRISGSPTTSQGNSNGVNNKSCLAGGNSNLAANSPLRDESSHVGNSNMAANARMRDKSSHIGNSNLAANSQMTDKSCHVGKSNLSANSQLIDKSSHVVRPTISQAYDCTANYYPNMVDNSRLSPQDRIALSDFIAVVKENLGINSKLLIQCQVTDSGLQSLLLWIMDRNLILCTSTGSEALCTSTRSEGLGDATPDRGSKQDQSSTEDQSCKKSENMSEKELLKDKKSENMSSENKSKKELLKDSEKCGSCGNPRKILHSDETFVDNVKNNLTSNGDIKIDTENIKNTKHNVTGNQKDNIKPNKDTADSVDVPVKVYNVMKVLYTYAKDKPDPSWSKDFSLPHVNVSKSMFLNALKHLRVQGTNIPTPYRFISEMHVSYIVLGT
uniref:E3 ubiquitin-protein ligase E3D n=1 Tax=Cacopsylla melanoneura TaxID=428564 RepID=A0A8D8SQ70_9HEMI